MDGDATQQQMARVLTDLIPSVSCCRYVFSAEFLRKLQSEEMNKVALLLVFLCGVIFACIVSLLKNSWTSGNVVRQSLGAIPEGSDLELMDDGYIAMAMLGAQDSGHSLTQKQTTELEDRHVEIEALNTVERAKELAHSGKSVRAGRLLEHALSIAPKHPDVLVHYGEYLEQHRNDIVQADKMYLRALAISPANSRALSWSIWKDLPTLRASPSFVDLLFSCKKQYLNKGHGEYLGCIISCLPEDKNFKSILFHLALSVLDPLVIGFEMAPALSRNRRRTRPLVEEMDATLMERIDGKRDDLQKIPSSSSSLRRIKKEAYFQYIYHTAGIEGNTMTLSQTRMILETRLSVGGKSVMEHNEILGLDMALKYINTTLVHRVGRVSLHDILEIHRRVLGHVDPLEAGQLRTTQVYVSNHIPPPPTHLQLLMEDFVSWLNSAPAQRMHPIKYAALAHYKLVFIHPFSDGNGRTARLLMNFLLMQAGYPPVIIRKQDRMLYYDSLQLANQGDTRPFIRFIAECTEKTLDVYLWATKEMLPKIGQNYNPDQDSVRWDSTPIQEIDPKMARKDFSDSDFEDRVKAKHLDNNVPQWKLEDHFINEASGEGDQITLNEDDILSEDINNNDYGFQDHQWFQGDDDKHTVQRTGRFSKVVEEEDFFLNKDGFHENS